MPSSPSVSPIPPTKICVFCSTTFGHSPTHAAAARALAQTMHSRSIHLVYGGGTSGLMGELARTLVALSGPDSVHGIIPRALLSEERADDYNNVVGEEADRKRGWWARTQSLWGAAFMGQSQGGNDSSAARPEAAASLLSESVYGRTTIVRDLASRKRRMMEEIAGAGPGSGFVALSGGFGTMDEVMEVVTGRQMGMHRRGICLLNVEGFWDGVVGWVEGAVEAGFVREEGRGLLGVQEGAEECVEWLRQW